MSEPNKKAEPQTIALTPEVLQQMISSAVSAAVSESKKPSEYELMLMDERKQKQQQEVAKIQQENANREDNAANLRQKIERDHYIRLAHTHRHPNGDSQVVYVKGERPEHDFLLCQECQAVIRQGAAPKDYKGRDIYNTALYIELFQTLRKTDF